MKKLGGKVIKNNIAVFISGRGSNLRSIIKYSTKKKFLYKVELVLSNKQNAKGLLFAKKRGIKNYSIDFTKSKKLCDIVLKILKKKPYKTYLLGRFYENITILFY